MTLRLVLDTNVWLDWLVFDDAGVAPLKAAVAAGGAQIFIDDACAGELTAVLAYPLRKQILGVDAQAACIAECRRVAQNITAQFTDVAAGTEPLPKCRDADDQKFLELARACRADFLVTRDLMLLELSRRKVRRTPFAIVTPAQLMPALATR
ncbi:MAG TPA: putative toxin-antitoxin system toxin component, PIN family [Burkholderiales bacterium]|nr:putative toxin-antitoxin system toxin component, PIN family [Burkholderiales bacterium]